FGNPSPPPSSSTTFSTSPCPPQSTNEYQFKNNQENSPPTLGDSNSILARRSNNFPRALKLATNDYTTLKVVDRRGNWFDCIAINYLTLALQKITGKKNEKNDCEGLLETTQIVARDLDPAQQPELVIQDLKKAIPHQILSMANTSHTQQFKTRKLMSADLAVLPNFKFAREVSTAFTTFFFVWLVGPSEFV
ncbi:hypothetical protein V2J09_010768, partial [Rumex salicifolius]